MQYQQTFSSPSRIAANPHVIHQILLFSEPATQAACARVCKDWLDPALDLLWKECTELVPLLRILSPLQWSQDGRHKKGSFTFEEPWGMKNWDRFYFYSERISRLSLMEEALQDIKPEAFYEVGLSKRSDNPTTLFPDLVHLGISVTCKDLFPCSLLFLQDTVETVDITLSDDAPTTTRILEEIPPRIPEISGLIIRFIGGPSETFQENFKRMISQLTNLGSLMLPEHELTSDVMSALSALPYLQTISTSHGRTIPANPKIWSPLLGCDAFPSLEKLVVSATFSDITHFLNDESAPNLLTSLKIRTTTIETVRSTRGLITAISHRCPDLAHLALSLSMDSETAITADLTSVDFITFSDIRPIVGIPSMKTFDFRHHHRLVLSDDNILEIVQAWPEMESLWLNPDPISDPDLPRLTPLCLNHVKNHCPVLRILGLHIDFSYPILNLSEQIHIDRRMAGLTNFNLGTSPLGKGQIKDTAVFLSTVVTSDHVIQAVDDWPDVIRDVAKNPRCAPKSGDSLPKFSVEIRKQWGEWKKVRPMLRVILRVMEFGLVGKLPKPLA